MLEPRFTLPTSTPRSSKTPLVISGLQLYVYGLEELATHSEEEEEDGPVVDIAVLYLAHNRTRTYLVTEGIAHEVLHRYRSDGRAKRRELIAVTFNMRNHGDRETSSGANRTWKDGNEAHGVDLMSLIDGSALDFKLVMSYLPAYLPQCRSFYNIMGGVSLGAHTAWRMAALVPGKIDAFFMVVGCPNLTALMLSRLGIDPEQLSTTPEELYKVSYDDLTQVMTEQQRKRWPRVLSQLVSEQDRLVDEAFPPVPVLLMGGKQDRLVPVRHTRAWVRQRRGRAEVELFVQDNTGHSCTEEMVGRVSAWLSGLLLLLAR
ncbi:hypothetical protein PVAG01_08351 [Phlyctema vagabunda]|uniref:AB hydrolase-1 domain-containing protein n=1 Tax=Phlyctema vagabunda TaxID=108571 RepID=A0ABR4P959_9HELO